jgi:hypothetical protein
MTENVDDLTPSDDESETVVTRPERDAKTGRFLQGTTGLPGRPKGARNKLAEAMIDDLYRDWTEHGIRAIQKVRRRIPCGCRACRTGCGKGVAWDHARRRPGARGDCPLHGRQLNRYPYPAFIGPFLLLGPFPARGRWSRASLISISDFQLSQVSRKRMSTFAPSSMNFSNGRKYGVIYADPPWSFRNWSARGTGRNAVSRDRTLIE